MSPARGQPTVLVVDDDPWVRSCLGEALEGEGYVVSYASNGSAALRLIAREQPGVVVLDLALPERTGLEVLLELRRDSRTQGVRVIVVTANPAWLRGTLPAPDAVLEKPFAVAELLASVRQRSTPLALAR